jgi:hypothetical protein
MIRKAGGMNPMQTPILGVMTTHIPKNPTAKTLGETWDALAAFARMEQLELLVFVPEGVHLKANTVSGFLYQDRDPSRPEWRYVTKRVPKVIYDGALLQDLRHNTRYKQVRTKLRQMRLLLFNPSFPNKSAIHKLLYRSQAASFLPPTTWVNTLNHVLTYLQQHQWVFLKPIRGSGGKGIVELRVQPDGTVRMSHEQAGGNWVQKALSEQQLRGLLRSLLRTDRYIVQKALPLIEANEQKLDFRVPLYRDRIGQWQSVGVICRLGRRGSAVTNFHSGGTIVPFAKVEELQKQYGFPLPSQERMTEVAILGAHVLSQKYHCLGTLGIDVGVDEHGDPWLLDFNPRQGRDIMTPQQIEQAMNYTAQFAKYLLLAGKRCSS